MWLYLALLPLLVLLLAIRPLGAALIALATSRSPPLLVHKLGPRVLVLTAHPDDESMFFGPAILNLYANHNLRMLESPQCCPYGLLPQPVLIAHR